MLDIPSASGSEKLENGISSGSSPKKDDVMANTKSESLSGGKGLDTGESSEKKVGSNNDDSSHTKCLLGENMVSDIPILPSKPLFLSKNWRDILCRCEKCLDMYNQKHIGYLADKEDSIVEYERTAKQKREEKLQQQEGAELSFLNKLGHVEKMEILNGIADMKDEFRTFLVCPEQLTSQTTLCKLNHLECCKALLKLHISCLFSIAAYSLKYIFNCFLWQESFDPSNAITSADVHQIFENLAKKRRRVE